MRRLQLRQRGFRTTQPEKKVEVVEEALHVEPEQKETIVNKVKKALKKK